MIVLNFVVLVLNAIILYIVVSVAKENKVYFEDFSKLTKKCHLEMSREVDRLYKMTMQEIEEYYKRIKDVMKS